MSLLHRLLQPFLLAKIRSPFDAEWQLLAACRGTRAEVNLSRGQLLLCDRGQVEIRPLAALLEARACDRRSRRGRPGAELRLKLGLGAGDLFVLRCHCLFEAEHLAVLLSNSLRGGRSRPMRPVPANSSVGPSMIQSRF